MGYHDTEYPTPSELFPMSLEPREAFEVRLRQRLREGHGRPIVRIEQLDAIYDELEDNPDVRLEYDRFLPDLKRHAD